MELPEAFVDDMVTWLAKTVHCLIEEGDEKYGRMDKPK